MNETGVGPNHSGGAVSVPGVAPMNIACLGGGPAGLYFAISLKLRNPAHEVTVFERSTHEDTCGWGVLLPDRTLDLLASNDPVTAAAIQSHFVHWEDVAACVRGMRIVSTGHGFCGIGCHRLLQILLERALQLGVRVHLDTNVDALAVFARQYDLVVAADGVHSLAHRAYREHIGPQIEFGTCKFQWLGTSQKFDDALTFIFEQTEHGLVWAHAYQFDANTASFIVECSHATWKAFGFESMSRAESVAVCERLFAAHLGEHALMIDANNEEGSAWLNFPQVQCKHWSHGNVVLLGDAAATTHYSVGAGIQLAMEGAVTLAQALAEEATVRKACAIYEDRHRVAVLRLQSAARNSMTWFEGVARYADLDPIQFTYSLLTRSHRIGHENLRLRDPQWLASAEHWFQERAGARNNSGRTPMFAPIALRDLRLENRVVVAPIAQFKAIDGGPRDWHLVHYAERAKGGAGLVITEMTAVSPEGRKTPGCPGLYADEHIAAWRRITEFVHQETEAKICCQLGHSGPKGSTRPGWEAMDGPLRDGNWPLLAASPVAWSPQNQQPRAMTEEDMATVTADFVDAAHRAEEAGFDMLELHCAHGHLLSSFITPITNQRQDQYGGSLENRLRFPTQVLRAVRAVWPAHKPMSVRYSADDWVDEEGITLAAPVEAAVAFKRAGADICHASSAHTSIRARPAYGRMSQTPLADRIRNEGRMATIAAGSIYKADDVNSILLAGRADLVSMARPHVANPYWTLHVAAGLCDRMAQWPLPYLAGRDQLQHLAEQGKVARGVAALPGPMHFFEDRLAVDTGAPVASMHPDRGEDRT